MKLVIMSPDGQGKEFEIQDGNNLIGRWDPDGGSFPEIDLEQEDVDAKISRKHCVVEKKGDEISVQDIGSLNGTFVNKTRRLVEGESFPLKNGDEFIVGKIILKVVF